jgi:hypothetical protein
MPFLDFISKNRQTFQQEPVAKKTQEQKPDTAKEMYTRQSAQEKVNQKPREQLPQEQKAELAEVKARLEKATQHIGQNAPASSPSPPDSASTPQPMRQNMTGQDKAAPALSPTSAQAGQPATEKNAPEPSNESQAKTPEKAAGRTQQTLPRPRASWER